MFFQGPDEGFEVVLHVFFDSVKLLNFFFLDGFAIFDLLFEGSVSSELEF